MSAFKHITIRRIPVDLALAMNDAHNADVMAEERLALAAPDMLKALIDLRAAVLFFSDMMGRIDDWPEVQAATDAIAKATGSNP